MDFSPPSLRSVGLLKVGFLGHVTKLGFWVSWIPPWEGWRAWTNLGLFEVRWTVQHFLAERPEVITLSWRKCDNPSSLESGVKGQMILFEDFVVVLWLSHVQLFATPWTVACQAPLYMGFSRQEYWSKLPFPSPGDHPNRGSEPRSPTLQADSLPSEPPGKPCNVQHDKYNYHIPGMVEPGGLSSMRSQRVRHDWSNLVVVVY